MKVITFSRFFPSYHPKAGQLTYFVEKIWAHLIINHGLKIEDSEKWLKEYRAACLSKQQSDLASEALCFSIITESPKIHTIRAGHRWKQGEQFSPRVWSGRPYFSKQIVFAPPITISKTAQFNGHFVKFRAEVLPQFHRDCVLLSKRDGHETAANDGLSYDDFVAWFAKEEFFNGQIIHF